MTDPAHHPWLVVVGMHRSGTSAVAGMLGALGLALPRADDRMEWSDSNPEHWESLSMSVRNESILNELGGSWDAPPDIADRTGGDPRDKDELGAALSAAFPEDRPAVWKDPRLCLLLPLWRTLLTGPLAAVYIWRSPMAVARSLARRNAMPIHHGLALWERYNREAIDALCGIDTYVVDYATVTADPPTFVASTAEWLATLAGTSGDYDAEAGTAAIAPGLDHERENEGGDDSVGDGWDGRLSTEQQDLAKLLDGVAGPHRPFEQRSLGAETPSTRAILDLTRPGAAARARLEADVDTLHRQLATLSSDVDNLKDSNAHYQRGLEDYRRGLEDTERERDALASSLSEANAKMENLYGSTSWRVTRPVRTSLAALDKLSHKRSPP